MNRKKRRRIAVVTGTRAEYGLLESSMRAIAAHPRLELQFIVTGIHLLRHFGHTIDQIRADGWTINAAIPMQRGDDQPADQAAGLGRGVAGIARFLVENHTDVVLVLGDRIEAMAGALAAVTTGRVLAHIHGGDVALGDFDESLRHAITKLAHVHFTATKDATRRVIRMGERPECVHCVGAPGLDRLREIVSKMPAGKTKQRFALVVQHAHGRSAQVEQLAARNVFNAVAAAGMRRVILYPNTDRGHRGVIAAIDAHVRFHGSSSDVVVHRSLPRDEYLRLLLAADLLIGNSSSGLIEAPLAGTPVVNVGQRQANRQPGGSAVFNCDETPAALQAAIVHALRSRPRRGGASAYGDGKAGIRVARVLASLRINDNLIKKQITY